MKWVFHFFIEMPDGRSCTYSAFDESETAAELRIRLGHGVPPEARFRLLGKEEDRLKTI